MKVRVLFEYDEEFAKAIGQHYGEGRATRATVRTWCDIVLRATADDIAFEHPAHGAEMIEEGRK